MLLGYNGCWKPYFGNKYMHSLKETKTSIWLFYIYVLYAYYTTTNMLNLIKDFVDTLNITTGVKNSAQITFFVFNSHCMVFKGSICLWKQYFTTTSLFKILYCFLCMYKMLQLGSHRSLKTSFIGPKYLYYWTKPTL